MGDAADLAREHEEDQRLEDVLSAPKRRERVELKLEVTRQPRDARERLAAHTGIRLGTVRIVGEDGSAALHHLELMPVKTETSGLLQVGATQVVEDYLQDLRVAVGESGPFETVKLDGREWVVVMTPYQD